MRLSVLAVFGVLAAATSVSVALAEPNDHRGGRSDMHGGNFQFSERAMDRMADRLDLDETTRQSVENVITAAQPEVDALRERAKANREAAQKLAAGDVNDQDQLNNIAVEKGQLVTESTLLRARIRGDIVSLLTDEQREILAQGKDGIRKHSGSRGKSRGRDQNNRGRRDSNDEA